MNTQPDRPLHNLVRPIHDESRRRGEMVIRTFPILLIPFVVGAAMALLVNATIGLPGPPDRAGGAQWAPLVPVVVLAMFSTALILLVRIGQTKLSAALLIAIWTLITTFFALANGVTSNWPAMLVLPICTAGLLIDGAASISLAALATLLVITLGWLELQGVMLPAPLAELGNRATPALLMSVGFWVGLFWSVAALTFLLARGLKKALDQTRLQAQALTDLSSELEERVARQTSALLAQEREAAMMDERTRVARDIHDTLAQGLTGIVLQLGAAQRALDVAPTEAEPHLDLAQRMAREALAEARRSIWNLRAPALKGADLGSTLQGLAMHPIRPGTRISFEQRGEPYPLSSNVESTLLRVGQEALLNVVKHAKATQASIVLDYAADAVRLTVCDDGVGFDEAELVESNTRAGVWGGFGLLGMRERVSALGGALSLTNEGGARVEAAVPRQVAQAGPVRSADIPSPRTES